MAAFRRLLLSGSGTTIGQTGAPLIEFSFPQFGDTTEQVEARTEGNPQAIPSQFALRALRNGPYQRSYELAQELASESETQEDYVQAVLRYLRDGFVYSETPPRTASNLDGFLFDAKAGYCQQFSGRDGAAAAHGRRARPRHRPASPPARWTPRRASSWSATSTPTRGSRSGTAASAG